MSQLCRSSIKHIARCHWAPFSQALIDALKAMISASNLRLSRVAKIDSAASQWPAFSQALIVALYVTKLSCTPESCSSWQLAETKRGHTNLQNGEEHWGVSARFEHFERRSGNANHHEKPIFTTIFLSCPSEKHVPTMDWKEIVSSNNATAACHFPSCSQPLITAPKVISLASTPCAERSPSMCSARFQCVAFPHALMLEVKLITSGASRFSWILRSKFRVTCQRPSRSQAPITLLCTMTSLRTCRRSTRSRKSNAICHLGGFCTCPNYTRQQLEIWLHRCCVACP